MIKKKKLKRSRWTCEMLPSAVDRPHQPPQLIPHREWKKICTQTIVLRPSNEHIYEMTRRKKNAPTFTIELHELRVNIYFKVRKHSAGHTIHHTHTETHTYRHTSTNQIKGNRIKGNGIRWTNFTITRTLNSEENDLGTIKTALTVVCVGVGGWWYAVHNEHFAAIAKCPKILSPIRHIQYQRDCIPFEVQLS